MPPSNYSPGPFNGGSVANNIIANGASNTAPNHADVTADGTELMNREQVQFEELWSLSRVRQVILSDSTITNATATTSFVPGLGILFSGMGAAGTSSNVVLCNSVGFGATAAANRGTISGTTPLRIAGLVTNIFNSAAGNLARLRIGIFSSNTVQASDNAASLAGNNSFCVEFYCTGSSDVAVRVISRNNAGAQTASAGTIIMSQTAGATVSTAFVLAYDGAGTLNLYATASTAAWQRPPIAVTQTCACSLASSFTAGLQAQCSVPAAGGTDWTHVISDIKFKVGEL